MTPKNRFKSQCHHLEKIPTITEAMKSWNTVLFGNKCRISLFT
jgi:hypothetical protein